MHLWLIFLVLAVSGAMIVRLLVRRFQELKSQLREARTQFRDVVDFLHLFTRSLATVAEVERAMELVAHHVCDVTGAESVGIFLVHEDEPSGVKHLQGAAFAGLFPPFHRTAPIVLAKASYLREHLRTESIPFGDGILGRVAQTQQSVLVRSRVEDPAYADDLPRAVRTLIAVPMLVENRLIGVVCAVNCRAENRYFDQDSVRMLENLSYQAALASNLITIYSERSQQQRIFQELEFARQIQMSLLPKTLPSWGDFRVHAFCGSAREVGGDFYDFVPIDERRMMVVVADASGKGVPACMLMAMCQSFVRASAQRYRGMQTFLSDLNHFLFQDTDRAHFVTMAVCVIDRENNVCEYARAGHTELLVRRADRATEILNPAGAAVGLLPEDMPVTFETVSFPVEPGTAVVAFTDGITEALDPDAREFGLARLVALLNETEAAPGEMTGAILEAVERFKGDAPQADDQTIVILSRADGSEPAAD